MISQIFYNCTKKHDSHNIIPRVRPSKITKQRLHRAINSCTIIFNHLSYDCFRLDNQTFNHKTISNYENVVMEKYYKTNMSFTNELPMKCFLITKISRLVIR